jgi:response regulator RpfG family c-di-GMP phosphodiesterase
MPEMDGIELLARVRELSPDTVRMMLTGNADQETAIKAVNEGHIYRFLNKPCPPDMLESSVRDAMEQFRLITSERELLEKTLDGSIKVMCEILSQVNPAAFGRAYRIKKYVEQLISDLNLPNKWEISIAAMLSQLGCITLPNDLIEKVYADVPLTEDEQKMYEKYPETGARLLVNIPRMSNVAAIIALQGRRFVDFRGQPENIDEKIVRIGAQILKAVNDFDQLVFQSNSLVKALDIMKQREGEYNPGILKLMANLKTMKKQRKVKYLNVPDILVGMVINQDVVAKNGILLASKGQEVTYSVKERLSNFAKTIGISEPVECLVA